MKPIQVWHLDKVHERTEKGTIINEWFPTVDSAGKVQSAQ